MVSYIVVDLTQKDIFDKEIDLSDLKNNISNLYVVGSKSLMDLLTYENYPLKNKILAISQILDFLKYFDNTLLSFNREENILSIPQSVLIKYFNRDTYVKFINILKELKILSDIPNENGISYNYKKENGQLVTKRYRLLNYYSDQELFIFIPTKKNTIKYEIDNKYGKRFINTIKNIEIDIESAVRDEIANSTGQNSLRKRLNTIASLYEKRFIRKGENVDRIFHSLSNISKISRPYLHIKGKKFNNIDIKNCQPLLLCYYLLKNNMDIDQNYIDYCEKGILYQQFENVESYVDIEYTKKNGKIVKTQKVIVPISTLKCKLQRRNNIKRLLYKSIYFDFKETRDISNKFKELFPLTFKSLQKCNEGDIKMANRLQNSEAEVFNNLIPKNSKYYFTLFDAIYYTSIEDTGQLISDLTLSFHKIGLVPSFSYND